MSPSLEVTEEASEVTETTNQYTAKIISSKSTGRLQVRVKKKERKKERDPEATFTKQNLGTVSDKN